MSRIVRALFKTRTVLLLLVAPLVFWIAVGNASAQTAKPTVVDFRINQGTLFLEISMNAEAFVAGINPSADPSPVSSEYRRLRRLASSELEPHIKQFIKGWSPTMNVLAGGPVTLSYEGSRVPVAGDPEAPRISRVLLAGALPPGASSLQLTWPEGHGPMVLRQQGVDAPYTGYLVAGEASPLIPLRGGAGLDPGQTLKAYFSNGIVYATTVGLPVILIALLLVLHALWVSAALWQLSTFALATSIGLGLGTLQLVTMPSAWLPYLMPAATVVLGVWNVTVRRPGFLRLLTVALVGVLIGLSQALALTAIGVPPDRLAPAVLGFGLGALTVPVSAAAVVFALALAVSRRSIRLRLRISVLLSLVIAGFGAFTFVRPFLPF
nr:HupE/UreJ family protein [uncultured Ruegeria sp.]